ncbi:16139_t:CDS:2 [Acaulospora colombiana]|uniref:16139_t:CDS:1 n=1 Tax=Acaulospora colombiana TaxID=27376 RepID=A0ACA9KQF8_9GLOM|nr:16139_t:CDS:2 [Acaulospora colombiana]
MTIILVVNQVQSKQTAITRCTTAQTNSSSATTTSSVNDYCEDVENWRIIRNAVLAGILILFEVFFGGVASRYATELETAYKNKRRRVIPSLSLSAGSLSSKEYDPHAHHRPVKV